MEIDYVAIGKRIQKARKKQHLTQEQLAEMIGVSSAHISNIESGKKPFSFKTFVRLYTALNVNPDSLLLRRGELYDAVTDERFDSGETVAESKCESLLETVGAAITQWWQKNADI